MSTPSSMIQFNNVTKRYGEAPPVVQNLSITIPEGETCVIIGPSGCGKTTTMKMVNRLIEPTSGEIYVAGQNILQQDPIQLRRNIGYVIQQIGLFPHFSVRDNIAVVPKLLGWSKTEIERRVDDLLYLVGLEPAQFRHVYPNQLSGGQKQRVGVARALAADPPVMLMDEPFGAIDPITRDRLQNEFLKLQQQLKKTILFVTHDMDEAIKMGTLICILATGGVLQQIDTPAKILSQPANDFVAEFVGSDRGLKKLSLFQVKEAMYKDFEQGSLDEPPQVLLERMQRNQLTSLMVVTEQRQFVGVLFLEKVQADQLSTTVDLVDRKPKGTHPEADLKSAFSQMLSHGMDVWPVLDAQHCLVGLMTLDRVQQILRGAD